MKEKELIDLIQSNPDKGIHKAMALYGRAVNTICNSILGEYGTDTVDEAVSDTFFKLWKNSDRISLETGYSLKSYLYSIARNTAIDIRRKNGYSLVSLDDEKEQEIAADISIEEEIQKKELKQILHEVIERLGEPDNRVFLYKYFLFLKNKEIAKCLELPEKKVENILYRGKGKLKEMLEERGITRYEDR